MAYVDLYLDNPRQASALYPFWSIGTSINVDADAAARCGQGLTAHACVSVFLHVCVWPLILIPLSSSLMLDDTIYYRSIKLRLQ